MQGNYLSAIEFKGIAIIKTLSKPKIMYLSRFFG
jgi:hypothetical protein